MGRVVILGAGPSGLTLATKLLELGFDNLVVLEKESEAGGLCRSAVVDGSPIDIAGGHFLDVKRENVLKHIFQYLPRDEWNEFKRESNIILNGQEIHYPIESHIWQFSKEEQLRYLLSLVSRETMGGDKPHLFEDWIKWKFGNALADDYMLPYNRKIWSIDLNDLGTYWLHKLPTVSIEDTLRSCLNERFEGQVPAHGRFLYPKNYGYGEVWLRMANILGDRIRYNYEVKKLDVSVQIINDDLDYDVLVNTIPWKCLAADLPSKIGSLIDRLQHNSLRIQYTRDIPNSSAHWLYLPDESIAHHRILMRNNFVPTARGAWTETNLKRVTNVSEEWYNDVNYAYPLNTVDKPIVVKKLLKWAGANNIIGLGRWGEWQHMNSDVAVEGALNLASRLILKL